MKVPFFLFLLKKLYAFNGIYLQKTELDSFRIYKKYNLIFVVWNIKAI